MSCGCVAIFLEQIFYRQHNLPFEKIGTNFSGPAATLFIYDPFNRVESWRFVTYMLVHNGMEHILLNLLLQILMGLVLGYLQDWLVFLSI